MLKPLFNKVIIEPVVLEKKTASGIILPDTVKDSALLRGTVVAVGPGRMTDSGDTVPTAVSVGQKVLFKKVTLRMSLRPMVKNWLLLKILTLSVYCPNFYY